MMEDFKTLLCSSNIPLALARDYSQFVLNLGTPSLSKIFVSFVLGFVLRGSTAW